MSGRIGRDLLQRPDTILVGSIADTAGCSAVSLLWHALVAWCGDPARCIRPPVSAADACSLPSSISLHERGWLAGGALLRALDQARERLARARTVVYADCWATAADVVLCQVNPQVQRILVEADPAGDPYRTVMRTWLQERGVSSVAAREALAAVTPSWWRQRRLAPVGHATRWWILDAHDQPPDPAGCAAFVAQAAATGARSALITSHPPEDQQHLAGWSLVVHPADLDPGVLASLLHAARMYVAPAGPCCGVSALACCPADAVCQLPAQQSLPEGCVAQVQTSPSKAGSPPGGAEPAVTPSGAGKDGFAAWWRQLGPLIAGSTDEAVSGPSTGVRAPLPVATPSPPGADIAFLMCCHRYLQRFRVCLGSILRQRHPLDRIEVLVASPGNPDGLTEYVAMVQRMHPELQLTVVPVDADTSRYKGRMLNTAFRRSRAPVVLSTDCDILFPPDFVTTMLARHRPDQVLGCWRTPLDPDTTARILIGDLDPFAMLPTLAQAWSKAEETGGVRQGMLGYCQVVARQAWERVGYPEEWPGYNQSDIVFIERLAAIGVQASFQRDYHVVHLSHARDWTGTKEFL